MATYLELRGVFYEPGLRERVATAVVVAAQGQLVAAPGTAAGRAWALAVLRAPAEWGDVVLKAVLAANKGLTLAQISAASDAAIQANVDAAVAGLVAAHAGL
jgi:hypothetical protein